MKLYKLIRLEKIVEEVLQKEPLTREDDCYLILMVVQKLFPEDYSKPFYKVMTEAKYKGISFESITRARRKVQRNHPELVHKETEEARQEEQIEYMEYANEKHIPGY